MNMKQRSRWKQTAIAGAVAVALVGGYTLGMPDAAAISTPAQTIDGTRQYGPPSFAALVEQVKPAVVNIAVTGKTDQVSTLQGHQFQMPEFPDDSPFGEFFRHFFENGPGLPDADGGVERQYQAGGSGFIISSDGYVVTNHHVIEHADEIQVILDDGTRHAATVKGDDAKTDLALLKIEAEEELPYVELGDSDNTKVGEWVVAVGNPFGFGGSVTAGIISARGRDIHSGPFDDYLQIDAPINRGNSGGPLFDREGRVIGINTAIYSPSGGNVGIGFAIPANMAKEIIADLKSDGVVARGWLGVHIQPVTKEVAESLGLEDASGALVASVIPDSPAAKGGIQAGDIIVSMNGEDLKDFKDLSKLVARTKAGSDSTIEVVRRGNTRKLEVEIGRMPGDDAQLAQASQQPGADSAKLGIYLAELTPAARERHGIADDMEGVLVAGVKRGSPASKAGIRTGSVINMVGQEPVSSPEDVVAKVKQAAEQKKSSVLLLVNQKGEQRFVTVKFATA